MHKPMTMSTLMFSPADPRDSALQRPKEIDGRMMGGGGHRSKDDDAFLAMSNSRSLPKVMTLASLRGSARNALQSDEASQGEPSVVSSIQGRVREHARLKSLESLTVNKVPHGSDYVRKYCLTCTVSEMDRCSFCIRSRLSDINRMPMERLARELLMLDPALDARSLARSLSRYARSDKHAAELNVRILGSDHQAILCEPHAMQHDAQAQDRAEWAKRIKALEAKLAVEGAAHCAEVERLQAMIEKLEKDLEDEDLDDAEMEAQIRHLKRRVSYLEAKLHECEQQLKDCQAAREAAEAEAKEAAAAAAAACADKDAAEKALAAANKRISELEEELAKVGGVSRSEGG